MTPTFTRTTVAMKLFLVIVAAPALALSLACDPGTDETTEGAGVDPAVLAGSEAVARELDATYETFTRAYRQADVQLLMDSVYHDSAYYLPPAGPILRGKDQFRGQFSFLEQYFRGNERGPEIAFDILERDIVGDRASDIGYYTLRAPGAGPDEASRGKFIVLWRRDPGTGWRIYADGYSAAP
jgi:ketosteroid isomerase-like protein